MASLRLKLSLNRDQNNKLFKKHTITTLTISPQRNNKMRSNPSKIRKQSPFKKCSTSQIGHRGKKPAQLVEKFKNGTLETS